MPTLAGILSEVLSLTKNRGGNFNEIVDTGQEISILFEEIAVTMYPALAFIINL